jgi:hypothetical protein
MLCPSFAQNAGLTIGQVEKLVQLHNPDNVIASAVTSHGVAFVVTPQVLDTLKKAGAGDLTIAAVHAKMLVGSVTILNTALGSKIQVDQVDAGLSDSRGKLIIPELLAGNHHITASGNGWETAEVDFTLASNEQKEVSVPMKWQGGYLAFVFDAPSATAHITGTGDRKDTKTSSVTNASNLRLFAGSYNVTLEVPGRIAASQSVDLGPGDHKSLKFTLVRDPAYFAAKVLEARRLYGVDDQQAMRLTQDILTNDPGNAEATGLLAIHYLNTGDYNGFLREGTTAIAKGQLFTLAVMHQHLLFKTSVHDAVLKIDSGNLSYDPMDTSCTVKAFTIPLDAIELIKYEQKASNFEMMTIQIKDPNKNGKTSTLSFASRRTVVENNRFIEPNGSAELLHAYGSLIEQVKAAK